MKRKNRLSFDDLFEHRCTIHQLLIRSMNNRNYFHSMTQTEPRTQSTGTRGTRETMTDGWTREPHTTGMERGKN